MQFRLPKLEAFIKVNTKKPELVTNFIHVKNGIAIVSQRNFTFAVDLREYIKNEMLVDDEDTLKSIDEIIEFLNEKSVFSVEYWKNLTKTCFVKLRDNNLVIENLSYDIVLEYEYPILEDVEGEILTFYEHVLGGFKPNKSMISVTGAPSLYENSYIPGDFIAMLQKTFATELKMDKLVSKRNGHKHYLFSFLLRTYIFGSFHQSPDDNLEIFSLSEIEHYHDIIKGNVN